MREVISVTCGLQSIVSPAPFWLDQVGHQVRVIEDRHHLLWREKRANQPKPIRPLVGVYYIIHLIAGYAY